ncbi:MAG: ATP-binding cassette domain-containing protein, partial [Candidatus Competibacterales bacterium]|nr:ATP-binding cassette domain-containing protein [Candidatus Competibacterales bacterium]
MAEPLLRCTGLSKRFGAVTASDGLDLEVSAGELHALIGPNGAGKTTALAQLAGELAPDAGRIEFAGRDITALPTPRRVRLGLVRTYQVSALFPALSAADNVSLAVQARAG